MPRLLPALVPTVAAALALLIAVPAGLAATATLSRAASAASDHPKPVKKKHVRRVPRGTGFLPGYRTPEQIERQRYAEIQRERRAYYRAGGPRIYYWGYSDPRFYRGRWNGGGFGPCWTSTPIGYQWNCGK
ncbi:MAG: hypothetical protein WC670_06550 [Pseudolabrys sp.]|jgi:hypothetical protein